MPFHRHREDLLQAGNTEVPEKRQAYVGRKKDTEEPVERGNADIKSEQGRYKGPYRMCGSRLRHAQQPNEREPACHQQQLANGGSGEVPLIIALYRSKQGDAS